MPIKKQQKNKNGSRVSKKGKKKSKRGSPNKKKRLKKKKRESRKSWKANLSLRRMKSVRTS